MSRSNVKVASLLREAEGIKMKKNILKSGVYGDNDAIFNQLEESSTKFMDKLTQLKKFSKKTKTETKEKSLKMEWSDEQIRLQNLVSKIEGSISLVFEGLILSEPNFTSLLELVHDQNLDQKSRRENENELQNQLHLIKQMFKEMKKKNKNNAGKKDSFVTNETDESIKINSPIVSILAELLMKIKSDFSSKWIELTKFEQFLVNDLSKIKKSIFHNLRKDRINEQNNNLNEEFNKIKEEIINEYDNSNNNNLNDDCSTSTKKENVELQYEIIINEWYEKISKLDYEFSIMSSEKENEKINFCNSINIDYQSNTGEWENNDHEIFVKNYKKSQITGMLRKDLLENLKNQLPHLSIDNILLHEEWYRKMIMIKNKYKEREAIYYTNRVDLINLAKSEVKKYFIMKKEQEEKENEILNHEKNRQNIHQKLSSLRNQKEINDERLQKQLFEEQLKLQQKKEEEEEMLQKQRTEQKQQILQFQEKQRKQEQEVLKLRQEAELAAQAEIKRLIEENRPQVEKRAKLLLEKDDKKKQKETALLADELHRIELLTKLAAQVPYYEAIQNATSKLDHITISAQSQMYHLPINEPGTFAGGRGHMPLNGFTDQTVIRDSRFRLTEALRNAGIQNSDAAKRAVASFCPRPELAIHGLI